MSAALKVVRAGLFDTVVRKEWRLIRRDPHLISQVAMQLVCLLPLCLVIFGKDEIPYPVVTASLTLVCGLLSSSVAWIAVAAEDAPDLLRLSPAPFAVIRLAKLAAGVMPSLLLALLPLAWLLLNDPLAGILACFTVSGASCTAAVIVHWCGKPATRSDYKARGRVDSLTSILGMVNGLCWGGLGFCMSSVVGGQVSDNDLAGAAAAVLMTVLTLAGAWLSRRRER